MNKLIDDSKNIGDFRENRSDILIEIKGEIILLNEALTNAETDFRFMNSDRPYTKKLYGKVYYHIAQILKLSYELIPQKLANEISDWLYDFQYERSKQGTFLFQSSKYSREIQKYLYGIGVKDTNIRKHTPFQWNHYKEDITNG